MSLEQNINVPAVKIVGLKFPEFCSSLGIIPTSYKDSMTYYELLMWFCKYLEEVVIPAVNSNGEAVEELQNLYVTLKNYVDNYFSDLNISEEVNKKLDEMAESGELAEIIAKYLNTRAIIGFNTIAQMQASTLLKEGSFARTLGQNTYNDGKGRFYIIRVIQSATDVDGIKRVNLGHDDLYADAIPEMWNILIGNLNDLTTEEKENLVSAINELVTNINNLINEIGNLNDLTTEEKENLVSAINELVTTINDLINEIGNLNDLTTVEKENLVSAINEVVAKLGNLNDLTTSSKTSFVSAINEVVTKLGNLNDLTTSSKTSFVSAINEINSNLSKMYLLDHNNKIDITPTHASYYTAPANGILYIGGIGNGVMGIRAENDLSGSVGVCSTSYNTSHTLIVEKGQRYQLITFGIEISVCRFTPFKFQVN